MSCSKPAKFPAVRVGKDPSERLNNLSDERGERAGRLVDIESRPCSCSSWRPVIPRRKSVAGVKKWLASSFKYNSDSRDPLKDVSENCSKLGMTSLGSK